MLARDRHLPRVAHRARPALWWRVSACVLLGLTFALVAAPPTMRTARAVNVPSGFQESIVFTGLTNPTAIAFAADGRAFIAEKSGLVKVFDGVTDTSPTIFADLRTNVHNFWDRGLLGLALDPEFPSDPWVYVLYTYDHVLGSAAPPPRWGAVGATSDGCPTPPGATGDGCVVSGRLSRLQASGDMMTGSEQVLIEDWCQQYPSHSIGSLAFGADGALYVSGGDGASFNFTDYGQDGSPLNPCGDPPGGAGTTLTPPSAEGGALRSQDVRTSGDPTGLDGAILRVDPATGSALAGNPLFSHSDPNARRIIAYGLRNPFRIATRPGTDEVWVGDVGWNEWEELDRIPDTNDSTVENFGWPCYEGSGRQPGYDGANLTLCENLYAAGPSAVSDPYYKYHHNERVVPNEACPTGGSSVAGLAFQFYPGGSYPAAYDGALFFADYSRDCIWVVFPGADGLPDMATRATFVGGAANPVDLKIGPGGELYYADFDGGTIRRIRFVGTGVPTECPVGSFLGRYYNNMTLAGTPAVVQCEPNVNYDWGTGSPAPGVNVDQFSVRWTGRHSFEAGTHTFTARTDDGMRVLVDGTPVIDDWRDQPPTTYTGTRTLAAGEHVVTIEFYENGGGAVAQVGWQLTAPANTPPTVSIETPVAATTWKVGDVIQFSGSATDPDDGPLAASALSWELVLHHCPSNCHQHPLQTFSGVASGSFTTPDHEYPSHLELRLTATDSGGASTTSSVVLDPQTATLTLLSEPTGLQLVLNGATGVAPVSRTVIVGSNNSVSAPSPQQLGSTSYEFVSWSDQGSATHNVTVPTGGATHTAAFRAVAPASMHVGDLDATASIVNKTGWRATAVVTLHDAQERPVAGVTVTGTWTTGSTRTVTCTTGTDGRCSFTTPKLSMGQAGATYTVTNATYASLVYSAAANHDPDGDSNGTAITVARPTG
jgi:glucose/arabinose dehydrogenase